MKGKEVLSSISTTEQMDQLIENC